MSRVQQASLEYGKAYIQQIEILQYIDFVKKKDDLNTCVSCGFTLLWHYIPTTCLWSACGTLYYYNKNYFWKIKQFLTNLCDFMKYIMQYNRIWEAEKLQLASSYTWQLMRLIHFSLNVTINHYWVFVITSDCDPMWILVKWWGINMLLVTFYKNFMWKIHSQNFCGAWRKSNVTSSVTNYCCQKVISKETILLLKGVTSNE